MSDPDARRYTRPSVQAQVLAALRGGPASERTLAVLTGADLAAVANCLRGLKKHGIVRRLGPTRQRGGLFVLAELMADTS